MVDQSQMQQASLLQKPTVVEFRIKMMMELYLCYRKLMFVAVAVVVVRKLSKFKIITKLRFRHKENFI